MSSILKIENIKKSFGAHSVLNGISFEVNKGDVISIVGASGSGKSTLLRTINYIEPPTSGRVCFQGKYVDTDWSLYKYRAKVGMVFQNFNLFNNLSVIDNCTIGQTTVLGCDKKVSEERALYYLDRVGMISHKDARPNQISGGQKQRVAIARALSMEPDVLLFDEPTSALDPEMIGEVLNVIRDLRKSDLTMLIVTHEMSFAEEISQRILFLDEGAIAVDTTPDVFFRDPQNPRAISFLRRVLDKR